jgi:hypothetical protein
VIVDQYDANHPVNPDGDPFSVVRREAPDKRRVC